MVGFVLERGKMKASELNDMSLGTNSYSEIIGGWFGFDQNSRGFMLRTDDLIYKSGEEIKYCKNCGRRFINRKNG